MKQNYQIRLVNRDLSLDDTVINFYGSRFQADKIYTSLAFVLHSSPYERIILALDSGVVLASGPRIVYENFDEK